MNRPLPDVFDAFLRSSLLLAAAALVVWAVLRVVRPKSPLAHRAAWGSVLLCGVLVFQISLEIPWYDPEPVAEPPAAEVVDELPDLSALASAGQRQRAETSPPVEFRTRQDKPAHASADWRVVVGGLWIAGMIVAVGLTVGSYLLLLLEMRRSAPGVSAWHRQWRGLLRAEGVRAKLPLLVHPKLGPMLCRLPRGFVVVVPEKLWADLSPHERLAILRHELAHYQRRDVWKSLVARLLAIPHWFNPLAWWAVRKFEEGGEWACDQRLLSHPDQVPAFARALLAMVEPEANRVCTTAARGSSLSIRLKRLLCFQTQEDSMMKRSVLFGVLICLVSVGLLRVQLVARAQQEEEARESAPAEEKQLAEFAGRLSGSGAAGDLKAALATRAGQLVLRDHAAYYDEQLRNEARNEALPDYLDRYFAKEGEKYRLREDQRAYRDELLAAVSTFNDDVAAVAEALHELSQQFSDETETDRLMVRFMTHEASATMLYIEQLRQRLRPDVGLVERLLGQVFVADDKGNYIVRPGRRAEAEQYLAQVQQIRKALKPMRAELKEWASEFAEKDEFHRRAKKALAEPLFASFIASEVVGRNQANVAERLEQFFENFGEVVVDTADGLEVVEEEHRAEIADVLDRYDQTVRVSKKLSGPLKKFAAKIDDSDDLTAGWKQILSSELAIVRLGGEYEYSDVEPGEVIRELLDEVLEESDNQELTVREDRTEEVTQFVRDMFRQFRAVRRRTRAIDEIADQIEDEELGAALQSNGGKFFVLHSIQNSLRGAEFNGLAMWIQEHFDESDNGLTLREGAEEMMREFLQRVDEVNEELKKDDF